METSENRLAAGPAESLPPAEAARMRRRLGTRTVVLIGMMGSGKSSVGRRLGKALGLRFTDGDVEIEKAAGMTIPEIFARHGEAHFRRGEARVMARLLEEGPGVLATGGGAWTNEETRALAAARGISIWLKAEPDVLLRRVRRRSDRPLLKTDDPEATLRLLLAERSPAYALADITLQSREVPHQVMVDEALAALDRHLAAETEPEQAP